MRAIPSVDEWLRSEFLEARKAQMDAQKAMDQQSGISGSVHYVDCGDDIVCDNCNAIIDDPTILLVHFGRRVACKDCYRRWHAHEPIVWRRLRRDGSIGEVVPPPQGREE